MDLLAASEWILGGMPTDGIRRVPHAVSATEHTSARAQAICMRGIVSPNRRWVAD